MAITPFVGTVVEANYANISPPLPTVPAVGDLIVVLIAFRLGTGSILTVDGYTQQYKVGAAARTLACFYRVATGGETAPTVVVGGGGGSSTIAGVAVVLRSSEGGMWQWGTNGTTYATPFGSTDDVGPIAPATGALSTGCIFFSGFKNIGDATNVAVLSGDSLTWTRFANYFTLTGADLSFVGSLGIWSGGIPTLTAKTFDFTDGSVPTTGGQLGQAALVNEVRTIEASPGYASLVGQKSNVALIGRAIQPSVGYAAAVAQKASFTRSLRTSASVGYAALVARKATLNAARVFQVARGSASAVGQRADLTYQVIGRSLDALSGYVSARAQKAGFVRVRPISVGTGYVSTRGYAATFPTPKAIHPAAGYALLSAYKADFGLVVPSIIISKSTPGIDLEWMYVSEDGVFGDIGVDGTDAPAWSSDLQSDIIVSLGTDARAAESDFIPDGTTDRRGWWGDVSPANGLAADEFGSLFWLLSREKQIPSVLVRVREYANRALQWIVNDGIADRIEVDASYPRMGWILLQVAIHRPASPPVRYRFNLAWQAQAARGAA